MKAPCRGPVAVATIMVAERLCCDSERKTLPSTFHNEYGCKDQSGFLINMALMVFEVMALAVLVGLIISAQCSAAKY